MPEYLFEHPETKEIKSIFQRMNEKHEFVDSNGLKWNRVFTKPTAGVDTKIDAFSAKDFSNKTANKKGTLGDLIDQSAELSEKRVKIAGKDFIKEKHEAEYSKKRGGRKPYKPISNFKLDV